MREIQSELRELDAYDREVEGGSEQYKELQMKKAVKEFNAKPKRGIEVLVEAELCDGSAAQIAKWLFDSGGGGLKKGAIGEYMGEMKELNLLVLEEFCKCHDFTGVNFDTSLRAFLSSFRLPGEAQKIDRMMEAFSARFCFCNPNVFSNNDTCYILAFATIMLNTGLHNPAVKNKQTLESFLRQVRGIDDGKDLPKEMLTELFNSILTNEFKLPEDEDGTLASVFMNPVRCLLGAGGDVLACVCVGGEGGLFLRVLCGPSVRLVVGECACGHARAIFTIIAHTFLFGPCALRKICSVGV
jgi:cytohesin